MGSQSGVRIQGTPYVPGLVSGVLQRGMDGPGSRQAVCAVARSCARDSGFRKVR
jgi:hypothetical protein